MERVQIADPQITLCSSSWEALDGADAMMLTTEWNEFRTMDLERIKDALKKPIMVDCRNVYEPGKLTELGFQHACFGRPD
jgi:UDPglucose 6-dehydrogenase